MSDAFFITPGLRRAPSFLAKARRPAAVSPPFGSFSRALAARLRADFFTPFLLAARLRVAFLAERFLAEPFLADVFFDFAAMRMLSTRLGYGRPARRARAFAADFFAGERWMDFLPARLRGFGRFQGARGDLAMRAQRRTV